jgi:transcriptional regulator with XRE-family HTH domain
MTFGEMLKALREARGLSQAEMAEAAGLNVHSYRDWEHGRSEPLFSAVRKIARVLGVSMDLLPDPSAGGKGKRPPRRGKSK